MSYGCRQRQVGGCCGDGRRLVWCRPDVGRRSYVYGLPRMSARYWARPPVLLRKFARIYRILDDARCRFFAARSARAPDLRLQESSSAPRCTRVAIDARADHETATCDVSTINVGCNPHRASVWFFSVIATSRPTDWRSARAPSLARPRYGSAPRGQRPCGRYSWQAKSDRGSGSPPSGVRPGQARASFQRPC
jgi:hypothetical protein